ncbi:hypothetical protein AM571_PC00111 (plasmid) [Rhizobium etli 8C-3]|uniref:Uncharacterized protein n=2 Tax=Rhizobium etli TaxID=29449 RepID=A0A1L5PC44_RHIET|nr:hypothetical protein AM571_PC00111 [Rhizobium etli 8C-3]
MRRIASKRERASNKLQQRIVWPARGAARRMQKRKFLVGMAVLALSVVAGGEDMALSRETRLMPQLEALRQGMPMSAVEKG